jgi:hypothetical protein
MLCIMVLCYMATRCYSTLAMRMDQERSIGVSGGDNTKEGTEILRSSLHMKQNTEHANMPLYYYCFSLMF